MSTTPRQNSLDFTLMSLREEIRAGRWLTRVPGERETAARLKVSKNTVGAACARLVAEGWLVNPGRGRRLELGREWLTPGKAMPIVRVLLSCRLKYESATMLAFLMTLKEEVEAAGFGCEFSRNSQAMLKFDARKIVGHMEESPGDVWIIPGGHRELLELVASRGLRAFALAGAFAGSGLPSGGFDAGVLTTELVERMVALGHRRIVYITSPVFLRPTRGIAVAAFAEAMAQAGITVGAYHLPEWDGINESFVPLLQELFRVTPPTALILSHPYQVCAAYAFFSEHGLRVPKDVSLVVMDSDPAFAGMMPPIARVEKDWDSLRRLVLRWLKKGALAERAVPSGFAKIRLVPGGTLGPAP